MSTAIVQLTNVSKHYKSLHAVDDLSFSIQPGEVLGLFGHNGAGKTTTMKLILGVIEASEGTVSVFGSNPSTKQAWQSRKQIGYLPENVSFYEQLTGLEVLTYFARLKSAPKAQVKQLLTQVGLADALNRQVKTYSKGMRQRLGLAQAFWATQNCYCSMNQPSALTRLPLKSFTKALTRSSKAVLVFFSVLTCFPGLSNTSTEQ